jgi:hypothetical protein
MNCGQPDLLSLVYHLGRHIEAGYPPMRARWQLLVDKTSITRRSK